MCGTGLAAGYPAGQGREAGATRQHTQPTSQLSHYLEFNYSSNRHDSRCSDPSVTARIALEQRRQGHKPARPAPQPAVLLPRISVKTQPASYLTTWIRVNIYSTVLSPYHRVSQRGRSAWGSWQAHSDQLSQYLEKNKVHGSSLKAN
jgi:hypothetical protein